MADRRLRRGAPARARRRTAEDAARRLVLRRHERARRGPAPLHGRRRALRVRRARRHGLLVRGERAAHHRLHGERLRRSLPPGAHAARGGRPRLRALAHHADVRRREPGGGGEPVRRHDRVGADGEAPTCRAHDALGALLADDPRHGDGRGLGAPRLRRNARRRRVRGAPGDGEPPVGARRPGARQGDGARDRDAADRHGRARPRGAHGRERHRCRGPGRARGHAAGGPTWARCWWRSWRSSPS